MPQQAGEEKCRKGDRRRREVKDREVVGGRGGCQSTRRRGEVGDRRCGGWRKRGGGPEGRRDGEAEKRNDRIRGEEEGSIGRGMHAGGQ